jgi:hypothetical protein
MFPSPKPFKIRAFWRIVPVIDKDNVWKRKINRECCWQKLLNCCNNLMPKDEDFRLK